MKEVSMKEWRIEEARRQGKSESAIGNQVMRGRWRHLDLRRESPFRIWVRVPDNWPNLPPPEREAYRPFLYPPPEPKMAYLNTTP